MTKTLSPTKVFNYTKKEWFRWLAIAFIFVLCLLPLFTLLFNIKGLDLKFIFQDKNFYNALGYSLLYTFIATAISTILALSAAYLLNRSNLKYKKIWIIVLTFSMFIPTISVGLGIRTMFGKNGFADLLFGIEVEATGLFNLIFGSIIIAFPFQFLLIYDALQYEDKSPYDAAKIMGIPEYKTFFSITIPYLKKPLISAFFACFTLIFSDYGVPMEVAGKIKTLPMYLYEQAVSSYQYGRAATIGLFLLIPAVLSFVIDIFIKNGNGEETNHQMIKRKRRYDYISACFLGVLCLFLASASISFVALSFIKGFPNNIVFTIENFKDIFSMSHGVGLGKYLWNSILIAILTAFFGMCIAFVIAYFSTRLDGIIGKILHFFAISSIAIPGLVLGIGYIFLFKGTNKFFYGTIAILVVVNIIHFIGQPYIMARNSMSKINKDYELIGSTLGISKIKIFFKVIIPNSKTTLLEMFSYFFLNAMITISAVAFLCTYKNQPLSILITSFERTGNYEMQAVISVMILVVNVIFKLLFTFIQRLLNKTRNQVIIEEKKLTRSEFELLTYIDRNGARVYSSRYLANELAVSYDRMQKDINNCMNFGYLQENTKGELSVTEEGYKVLEPFKVKRAIVLAAGFGSRMAPVTLDTPKPLVKVNGVRIIDTLLDALIKHDIKDIVIVRGYKKEKFDELLDKYPMIRFIDNCDYNITNNISSAVKAINFIDRCYICEADLILSNSELIRKYEYCSNYLGAKVLETDDWCFTKKGKYIDEFKQGGENCYQAYGISYWTRNDSEKLRENLNKLFNSRAGKEQFWDSVPFKFYKKDFNVEIRKCQKTDIIEIDNFHELIILDASYANYPGHEKFLFKQKEKE